jgi:DNA-binding transcriptional LysR family regulator
MTNITNFDLNLLRVLDALLQEGSTVRAAKRLGLSQPAVSAALGRLRAALGDELFYRHGQGLEPTVLAKSLSTPLREILVDVENLLTGTDHFDPSSSRARFKISGSDFFAEMLMPQLADRFSIIAPEVKVHLVDLVPDNYIDPLEQYGIDLALIPKMDLPDWTQSQHIFDSGFAAIARKNHPHIYGEGILPGGTLPLDLFCELGHVLFSQSGDPQAFGDEALAKVGRTRRIVMTLPVFSGIYRAVAGSDLIALLPTPLAHKIAESAGIDVYQPPVPINKAAIIMVWHRQYTNSPTHIWLRNQVANMLEPLDYAP